MKRILALIPEHVVILLKRLGIAVIMLYITRIIFLLFNLGAFQNLSFLDFFTALWFDLITVGLFFLPYYVLFLLPLRIHHYKIHRIFFKLLFHFTNALLIALNLLDVEYFKYTSKRSTYDLFTTFGGGEDVGQLLTTFIKDFWFLILFLILLITATEFLYRKTEKRIKSIDFGKSNSIKQLIGGFIVFVPLLFFWS